MTQPTFLPALALDELPVGKMRGCTVAGRKVLLCHTPQGVFAVDNVCTHAYACMNQGRLRGVRLICPLHGAAFDVRDGSVLGLPATRPLPAHALRIVDGQIEVAIAPGLPSQLPA